MSGQKGLQFIRVIDHYCMNVARTTLEYDYSNGSIRYGGVEIQCANMAGTSQEHGTNMGRTSVQRSL